MPEGDGQRKPDRELLVGRDLRIHGIQARKHRPEWTRAEGSVYGSVPLSDELAHRARSEWKRFKSRFKRRHWVYIGSVRNAKTEIPAVMLLTEK
jgi:hypothetical protein